MTPANHYFHFFIYHGDGAFDSAPYHGDGAFDSALFAKGVQFLYPIRHCAMEKEGTEL